LDGLRLNVEYYQIDQFDAVSAPTAQFIVDHESLYPGRVTRDGAGAITLVNASAVNLFRRVTEGVDVSVDYSVKTGLGQWSLHAVHTTVLHLKEQYSATLPLYDGVGYPNEGFAAKSKSNAGITWERKRWTLGWTARHFSSYHQYGAPGGPAATAGLVNVAATNILLAQGASTIPSQTYHDLMVGYSFPPKVPGNSRRLAALWSDLGVTLGVRNVFNQAPPFDVFRDAAGFYMSSYGDPRLRTYWLSVRKGF
jgi:outer membrane receptor protein involved in Fe transport